MQRVLNRNLKKYIHKTGHINITFTKPEESNYIIMTNISEPMDPLNMLPLLNTVSEENDFQEICTICQDVLDNGEEQIHRL